MADRAGQADGPPVTHRALIAWLPVLAFEAMVLFLSSRPHLPLPTVVPHLDKAAHFAEYALLGWLLRRALAMTLPRGRGATALAIVLVAFLGAGDEMFQRLIPGRDSSPWDWLADLCGGATGALVARWCPRLQARPAPSGGVVQGEKG